MHDQTAAEHRTAVSADIFPLSIIRPSTLSDAPEIASLLAAAGLRPNVSAEELYWKYWQGRTDWQGPRSFVMTRGPRIVAHAGILPGLCLSLGQQTKTIHLADWAARVDALGAGVAIMKYAARSADALIAIGGSTQTMRILPHVGFETVGRITLYVRPLRPLSIIAHAQEAGWRILPRAARGWLWSMTAPQLPAVIPEIHQVTVNTLDNTDIDWPAPNRDLTVFNRSSALMRHALTCPRTPMELYTWRGQLGQRGYFVLAFAPLQVRLVDYWTPSNDQNDWRSLLDAAVGVAFKRPNAVEITAYASDAALAAALRDRGFRPRGFHPIQWLQRQRTRTSVRENLRIQMLDNDTGYNHHGRATLWT